MCFLFWGFFFSGIQFGTLNKAEVEWLRPPLNESAVWGDFLFFFWCQICDSAHCNPKEVFAVCQPALSPYVASHFRMFWSGRFEEKKGQKVPLRNMSTKNNLGWGRGTSLRLMFCFSLSDITCCLLVLSMNLHRSRCTQSVAALFSGPCGGKKNSGCEWDDCCHWITVSFTNKSTVIFVYAWCCVAKMEKCCHRLLGLWNRMKIFIVVWMLTCKRKKKWKNIS